MAISCHHPLLWEEKLHFPQLHSGEQLCRSYSCTRSTETDLQASMQLHKHPWDFRSLHKADRRMGLKSEQQKGLLGPAIFPPALNRRLN